MKRTSVLLWALALVAGGLASLSSPAALAAAGRSTISLGADPTGRPCTARRLFGDPLLQNGRRDFAYDITCGRAGSVGRVYLLASQPKEVALRAWRESVAPLCVGPRPQDWAPEGLQPELGLFCGGGLGIGTRPAAVLLAASHAQGLLAGDAPPASAPVVEFAMRILAGVASEPPRARARGPRSALLANLETVLGGDLAGGGFGDFATLRAAAFENNSMWLFGSAELQFADALRVHAGLWPDDFSGRADLQSERGLNLANQRRFAEAERVLADAAANAAKSEDLFLRGKVAAYSALAALNAGRYAEVRSRAAAARELIDAWRRSGQSERIQADPSISRLPMTSRAAMLDAQMLRAAAIAASRERGNSAGREGLTQAAEVANGIEPRASGWLQSGIAQDRANLELQEGRPQAAVRILEEALAAYRRSAQGTRIEANLLMDLGGALQQQGREDEALQRFAQAFEIYREQTENRGVAPQRGMRYLDALAARLPAVASPAEAAPLFTAFEALATPAVAQTAAATAARLLAGPNGTVIRAWQDADRSWRRAVTRLSNLPTDANPEQRRSAEADVASWRTRVEALEQQVNLLFPNFGVLTLEAVSLDALRGSLGAGERLVRLALGSDQGLGLLIDRESVRAFRIGIGEARAAELVARVKNSVRNPEMQFDRAAAVALFEGLFANIRPELMRDGAPERLIIESGGALASLPFAVLVSGAPDASGEAWFARRFAVMTAPSMRAFVSARAAGTSKGAAAFAGFGDFLPLAELSSRESVVRKVVNARRLPSGCAALIESSLAKLPRLRGTAAELDAVRQIIGGDAAQVSLRESFTDRAILSNDDLSAARILMFSTHGVFGTDFPEAEGCLPDAALLTSAVGEGAGVFLDSAQVLDLKLDADLVVLSACDTGNPQPVAPGETGLPSGGDALSGLARSFFYAGARSVVVSHWVLPDEDTVALMRAFFERLQAGDAAPEALRSAQLAQIRSGSDDPLQWAALVVVGAPPSQ